MDLSFIERELVELPAAERTRIAFDTCSKERHPIGFGSAVDGPGDLPQVASHL